MTNRLVRNFIPFLLLSFPALAADQVVLTNGDTITRRHREKGRR